MITDDDDGDVNPRHVDLPWDSHTHFVSRMNLPKEVVAAMEKHPYKKNNPTGSWILDGNEDY